MVEKSLELTDAVTKRMTELVTFLEQRNMEIVQLQGQIQQLQIRLQGSLLEAEKAGAVLAEYRQLVGETIGEPTTPLDQPKDSTVEDPEPDFDPDPDN